MTSLADRAMSFGAIADDYDRLRPPPPASAVDWLLAPDCQVAVDLAAGTGLLTRALAGQVTRVVAVEPDRRMGAVLRARSPGVHVIAGRGEAIPLRDSVADGLFISSAWHWMTPELAVPEIGRVLRDGGRFGVIWTSRDREVDWIRGIDWLREPGRDQDHAGAPSTTGPRPGRREIVLPDPILFGDAETASFSFTRAMAADDFVAMAGTYSRIITASESERAATIGRIRAALAERFPGAGEIDVPMRSVCWRASRADRRHVQQSPGSVG